MFEELDIGTMGVSFRNGLSTVTGQGFINRAEAHY